MENLNSTM